MALCPTAFGRGALAADLGPALSSADNEVLVICAIAAMGSSVLWTDWHKK